MNQKGTALFAVAINLGPTAWAPGELDTLTRRDLHGDAGAIPTLTTSGGLVGCMLGSRASRAGIEALRQGGTAMDAALATAMTEIALTAGRYVSYAGIIGITYYDQATRQTYYLSGGYALPTRGEATGPGVLVPGFMAGVRAASERFGKLPFGALLSPAQYFAQEGFPVDRAFEGALRSDQAKVLRSPEGRALFLKSDGKLYSTGDTFRQPALAQTLAQIAAGGVDYFYKGAWATAAVNAIQAAGGKLTTSDLAAYTPLWTSPLSIKLGRREIVAPGLPDYGGAGLLEGLNTAAIAGLLGGTDPIDDGARLYDLIQIARADQSLSFMPDGGAYRGVSSDPAKRVSLEHAQKLWAVLGKRPISLQPLTKPDHSSGVLAIDATGNVAAVTHSINAINWGGRGLFVGGIALPDSGTIQRTKLARLKPGDHVPNELMPTLVLDAKARRPVFATTAIGAGLHEISLQLLLGFLRSGAAPDQLFARPRFESPLWTVAGNPQWIPAGVFPAAVLAALKQRGLAIDDAAHPASLGYALAARLDEEGKGLSAAGSRGLSWTNFVPLH